MIVIVIMIIMHRGYYIHSWSSQTWQRRRDICNDIVKLLTLGETTQSYKFKMLQMSSFDSKYCNEVLVYVFALFCMESTWSMLVVFFWCYFVCIVTIMMVILLYEITLYHVHWRCNNVFLNRVCYLFQLHYGLKTFIGNGVSNKLARTDAANRALIFMGL